MQEAQRIAQASCDWEESGLRSLFLRIELVVLSLFRGGLLAAVELQDRVDPDLPDALLGVSLLAVVFPAAQLAFHLDVGALDEGLGELGELAEDDATVPFGVRDILAALPVLVGGLGGQRERGEAAVVGGVDFGIAAEEADESDFVLIHDLCLRLLSFPNLLGSHRAEPSEWARLPSAKLCIYGGSGTETVTRRAAKPKQKSAVPLGAGWAPKQ